LGQIRIMTRRLADYWARLEHSVHPDDADLLRQHHNHGLNLDYPPPAYVGDIVNAPVVILDNNGGFRADVTPSEFPDTNAHAEHRYRLANPGPAGRLDTAPYYLGLNFWNYLASGEAALVNGLAYRSTSGESEGVKALTALLPSAQFHRRWLVEDIVPLVESGDRFVVAHRWSRWNEAIKPLRALTNCVFSRVPASPHLSRAEMAAAAAFLAR
jgi:hypothetical protein